MIQIFFLLVVHLAIACIQLLPQDAAQLVGELEGLANEVAATSGVPSMGAQLDSQGLEEEEATDTEWAQYKHFMGLLKVRMPD